MSKLSRGCLVAIIIILGFLPLCSPQSVQQASSDPGVTLIRSPADPRITVRFKSPTAGTCATVFTTQRQYAGYVSLPPAVLAPTQQNYSVNMFFWFIEARTNPYSSPLTIYINGGPGTSSMVGLFQETGPCEVVEVAQGRLGTKRRDWGWDRSSNIIYIDQPAQVGFSYDVTRNGSLNLITNQIQVPPGNLSSNQTLLNGTFASNNQSQTANTTEIAAHAAWHMLQGFLGVFPRYNPALYGNASQNTSNPVPVGVNLFAESYGGRYGPAFAALWEQQNLLRRNGTLSSDKTFEIRLSSLGILQGCIDDLVQGIYYPRFADNNTYAISTLPLLDEETAANSFLGVGGCQELIQHCRNAVQMSDPQNEGNVQLVDRACTNAVNSCRHTVIGPFMASGLDPYDITQKVPDPFPPSTYLDYLNQADVQASIGARVNFTQASDAVSSAFQSTGDLDRGESIDQMAYLLSLGVHVALIYGDRDYLCNWRGGEAISFSIAAQAPAYAPFYAAGYADIVVNDTYVGGAVRQYGNLSFSRIYDAGHLIPAYQPETMFTVFTRIISGSDISLGHPADLSIYKSNGTANATYTSKAPPQKKPICWVRDVQAKCTDDQKDKLLAGDGVIINGVLYDDKDDWKSPDASLSTVAGWPGHAPSPTAVTAAASLPSKSGRGSTATNTVPTGVFTATATPSPRKASASVARKPPTLFRRVSSRLPRRLRQGRHLPRFCRHQRSRDCFGPY